MNKIYTGVAVAGIAIAGVAAWWWQQPAPMAVDGAMGVGATAASGAGRGTANVGGLAQGGRAAPGLGGPAPVEVARAEALTLYDDVQAVGSLRARQGVVLRPEVSGRIARLGFADGQPVRKDQLLVQLDDTLQQAQLEQSRAQAAIARTNLQRSRELLAQGFVSHSAVDQNAAVLQVAEAQVALSQAQLARMRVLAPFDGVAGLRSVDVGDYVKDGADIVKLEDLSAMEVEFALPERFVGRTRAGLPVELALDAFPGRPFKGQIVALNSVLDANGRALLVRARMQNPGAVLRTGMFARARVVFAVRENAIVVPEEALVPLGARQFLFRVVDGGASGKVAQRLEAKIGLRVPGKVEIVDGLKPGDVVVTAGQARLMRGDAVPVRPIDLDRPGGAGPAPRAASAATQRDGGGAPAASAPRRNALQP